VCITVNASAAVIGSGDSVTRATANQRAAYNGVISVRGVSAARGAFSVWCSREADVLCSSCEEAVTSVRSV